MCGRRPSASASTPAYISEVDGPPTPVTFCEIFPPDDFPLYFYRYPTAPDLLIEPDTLPLQEIRDARVYWARSPGCRRSPAGPRTSPRGNTAAAGSTRSSTSTTGRCSGPTLRRRANRSARLSSTSTVAVGNREECEVAVGETDPQRAADALLDRGLELAVVKQGPRGVLAATREQRVEVPPFPVEVVNGLGAGDAFGGALVHGLLAGWPLHDVVEFCNVAGAIVASRLECSTAMPTEAEVREALETGTVPTHGPEVDHPQEGLR